MSSVAGKRTGKGTTRGGGARAASGKTASGRGTGRSGERAGGSDPPTMVSIGYGNLVAAARLIAIVSPGSNPMRRLREEAAQRGKLIDATEGRRTRSILVTDSDHVILSAINPETIQSRLDPEDVADPGA